MEIEALGLLPLYSLDWIGLDSRIVSLCNVYNSISDLTVDSNETYAYVIRVLFSVRVYGWNYDGFSPNFCHWCTLGQR